MSVFGPTRAMGPGHWVHRLAATSGFYTQKYLTRNKHTIGIGDMAIPLLRVGLEGGPIVRDLRKANPKRAFELTESIVGVYLAHKIDGQDASCEWPSVVV